MANRDRRRSRAANRAPSRRGCNRPRSNAAAQPAGRASPVLVNLDGFKAINDSLGQHSGDVMLQACGQRLRGVIGLRRAVARAGGDELPRCSSASADAGEPTGDGGHAHALARASTSARSSLGSVGMAICVGTRRAMPKTASAPCRGRRPLEAKRNGRAAIAFFSPRASLGTRASRSRPASDLRQPRVGRTTDSALLPAEGARPSGGSPTAPRPSMRWHHPVPAVSPASLHSGPRRHGLIVTLGKLGDRTAGNRRLARPGPAHARWR